MADFNQNLNYILNSVYGKDVRRAIYDALVYLSNNQGFGSGGSGSSNSGFYILPTASANTLGGIKTSSDFAISSDGKLSLANNKVVRKDGYADSDILSFLHVDINKKVTPVPLLGRLFELGTDGLEFSTNGRVWLLEFLKTAIQLDGMLPGTNGGSSGKSAYEIAKEHGFEGTEAEWIESLKAEPGGYYTPSVTNNTNGLTFSFAPSKPELPSVNSVTVKLPTSEQSGSTVSDTFNVKTYGAKGDGSTDDSVAIQAALNACHSAGGGTVFLPSGVYIIGSANGYVEFYSNTHILGEPGTTLRFHNSLAGTGIQALLRNKTTSSVGGYGCTENCIIENIIFDNNASIQKKATTLGIGHAKNITVKNCAFINGNGKSGSLHYLEFNACKDCKVIDCVFDKAKDAADQRCEMVNLDAATSGSYGDASYYKYDSTKCDNIEIVGCRFYSYKQSELPSGYFMSPAIGSHGTQYHDGLNVHDCQFFGDWNPAGVERRYTITFNGALTNTRIYNNLFVAGTPGLQKPPVGVSIQCNQYNNFIYDNKFIDYGAIMSTTNTVAIHYNNHLINTVNNTAEIDSGTINLSNGVLSIS